MGGYSYGRGNPVGQILQNATAAYSLGNAIARAPEEKLQRQEDREYQKQHRAQTLEAGALTIDSAKSKKTREEYAQKLAQIAGVIKAGKEFDDNELIEILEGLDVPDDLGTEEFDDPVMKAMGVVNGEIEMNSPEGLDAANRLLSPAVRRRVGQPGKRGKPVANARISGIYPASDGNLHFEMDYEDEDGHYASPVLDDDGKRVKKIATKDAMDRVMGLAGLHDIVKNDPILSAAFKRARGIKDPAQRQAVIEQGIKASYSANKGELPGSKKFSSTFRLGNTQYGLNEDGTAVEIATNNAASTEGYAYRMKDGTTGVVDEPQDAPEGWVELVPVKKGLTASKAGSADKQKIIVDPKTGEIRFETPEEGKTYAPNTQIYSGSTPVAKEAKVEIVKGKDGSISSYDHGTKQFTTIKEAPDVMYDIVLNDGNVHQVPGDQLAAAKQKLNEFGIKSIQEVSKGYKAPAEKTGQTQEERLQQDRYKAELTAKQKAYEVELEAWETAKIRNRAGTPPDPPQPPDLPRVPGGEPVQPSVPANTTPGSLIPEVTRASPFGYGGPRGGLVDRQQPTVYPNTPIVQPAPGDTIANPVTQQPIENARPVPAGYGKPAPKAAAAPKAPAKAKGKVYSKRRVAQMVAKLMDLEPGLPAGEARKEVMDRLKKLGIAVE